MPALVNLVVVVRRSYARFREHPLSADKGPPLSPMMRPDKTGQTAHRPG
jgi:hypothetical protein